jgi:REP element-mobilizing transposase RayT
MGTRIFHGRQLRKSRISRAGYAYMITTCCNAKAPLFIDVKLGNIVVDELRKSDDEDRTHTFAYVVMPDHLHWLFQLKMRNSLESVVRRTKGRSAYRINRSSICSGPVWQAGYNDRLVQEEESLETVGDYIVHNPVRAGIVENIVDYPLWDILWRRWGKQVRG